MIASGALARYRIAFSKLEEMRFTGNLDLHRTWERLLRRARLPLAYSGGFRPHPRISLGSALALGCTSQGELIDVWLEDPLQPAEIVAALRPAVPPGLRVEEVRPIALQEAALPTLVVASEYLIGLPADEEAPILDARLEALLAAPSLPRERRGKSYDLRPLIETLTLETDAQGGTRLRMRLSAREAATGRPEEVLLALGLDPARAHIHRVKIHLREPEAAGSDSA